MNWLRATLANVVLANLHAPVWWGGLMLVSRPFLRHSFSPGPQRLTIQLRQLSRSLRRHGSTTKNDIRRNRRQSRLFPDHLAKTGREEIISVLEAAGARAIVLGPEQSKYGAVETYAEAQHCAELFKKHAEEIDGIIVTLPNFGEERGIVDAIRLSGLKVPVLVQATPDRSEAMTIATRRDSFCGKMSACNNMMQYGINYSLTTLHTEASELGGIQG